jgi:hypothetical protein
LLLDDECGVAHGLRELRAAERGSGDGHGRPHRILGLTVRVMLDAMDGSSAGWISVASSSGHRERVHQCPVCLGS